MAKDKSRGKNPTNLTILKLCARAAGRCQFEGCNEYLFKDELTQSEFNRSNIAHIVASSPNGPRGDNERSYELSDDIDNLMLLCATHHKLVDDNPDEYTEEHLLVMKYNHEKAIAEQCSLIYKEKSVVMIFESPIKGKTTVGVQIKNAIEAVLPLKQVILLESQVIKIESIYDYKTKEYWEDVERQLEKRFIHTVQNTLDLIDGQHFSVFSIAPIPLIIKLGYLFGDKIRADIFQKIRYPDTWKWQSKVLTNSFRSEKKIIGTGNKIALVLSLTANIAEERVTEVYEADVIYYLRAEKFGVDCIQSLIDLTVFWHTFLAVCDEIRNTYVDNDEIALFPAIPVSAAFEIGRRYMRGVFPKLIIYDDDKGFFKTIVIGG